MARQTERFHMGDTVLVPVDGSPLSYRALRHALETYPDADVTVYHVADVFDPGYGRGSDSSYEPLAGSEEWYAMEEEAAAEILSEAETIASDHDREITTESEIGDPQRLIPDYARENDVDHVVLGVHGREEEGRSLFGRVAESVVYRSPVSVTIIR